MKCPYCTDDMEKGTIQSIREIFWAKAKKKLFFKPNIEEGDFVIAPLGWSGAVKEAYVCRTCQKVIMDIS